MNSNDLRTQSEAENSSGVLVSNKIRSYLLLVVVAFIAVFSIGMAKDMLKSHYGSAWVIIGLLTLSAVAIIFITNLRKIKYDPVNILLLEAPIYFKTSIIIFLIITIIPILSNIFIFFRFQIIKLILNITTIAFVFLFYLFLDLLIKVNKYNKAGRSTQQFDKTNTSGFQVFCNLPENFNLDNFLKKKELAFERLYFTDFRPFLLSKQEDAAGNIILNYTNKAELKFSLLFKKEEPKKIFIRYNPKNESVRNAENEIIRLLRTN